MRPSNLEGRAAKKNRIPHVGKIDFHLKIQQIQAQSQTLEICGLIFSSSLATVPREPFLLGGERFHGRPEQVVPFSSFSEIGPSESDPP